MASSSAAEIPYRFGSTGDENHIFTDDRPTEIQRTMRILERLALTLGVPVETFFETSHPSDTSDDASAEDVAELTRAFLAIRDPDMRRYCLDVVRAAGTENPTARLASFAVSR